MDKIVSTMMTITVIIGSILVISSNPEAIIGGVIGGILLIAAIYLIVLK